MNTAASAVVFQSEYLSAILSSIDESVVATDENFIIQYWNKGAEQIFGHSAEEAIGKRGSQIMKFHYPAETETEARQILINKGQWKGKLKFITKNKESLLLDISVTAVKNDFGRIIGYVGVHRDITEYDQTKTSLATFISVISSLDDNFFVVDKNLKVVLIDDKSNAQIRKIYGIEYLPGDNIISKLPANRKKQVKECFGKALKGEKSNYQLATKNISGKPIWLQVKYFPIKDRHGFIAHACSLLRDITAQKEIEEVNAKLYRSRKLFETFMENSPILSWITNNKGIIRYLNPYFLKSYKLKKDVIGKNVDEVFPEHMAAVFKENNQDVVVLNETAQTTEKIITVADKKHTYHVVKFPILSNDEIYIGGWALDITEEINLRETLMESLSKLQNSENELKEALAKEHLLNDMKSRFVSMASHEFRTPLSTILSSAFLLEKYTTTEQQINRQRHIMRIRESISHLNALLEDFLSLGRLEEGKTVIQESAFNLDELITGIIEELEPFKKSGQVVKFKHAGNTVITTDKKLLKNIIINLLNNAFKFSDEHKTVFVKSVVEKNKIIISIKDEGIGISSEDQMHLFESFYRGKNAQNIQGTGLGLHIVKRYIRLLNGDIKLESQLNKGTTVTVTIKDN